MPPTRPDGTSLTPDDLEFWNQPYVYREFPRMLYRPYLTRDRSILEQPSPEGTVITPDGSGLLGYVIVQSAAGETQAATAGWTDFAAAIANLSKKTQRRQW